MTHDVTLDSVIPRPRLRLERELPQPPAAVWHALTDRDELASWFPCDIVTAEWKIGVSLRFVFRGGEWHDLEGTVLECDEPRLLAFTWGEETLRFELSESGGGTRLVFTDELDPPIAARNAVGWEVCLARLARSSAEPEPWQVRFDHYVEAFGPALGPQEGPPQRP